MYGSEDRTARGGETGVVVRMVRAASALVTVLDADGRPVADATVDATTPGFHNRNREIPSTNAGGMARLNGLRPEGGYDLLVAPPPKRKDLLPSRLSEWASADTTVRLRCARRLVVRVQDEDGKPVDAVRVVARSAEDPGDLDLSEWGTTDASGSVTLEGLARLPMVVEARMSESSLDIGPGATATVEGEATEAVLRLDTGAAIRVRTPESAGRIYVAVGDPSLSHVCCHAECGPGETVLRGLNPGTAYDVFGTEFVEGRGSLDPIARARVVLLRGVRPGGEPVTLALAPAKEIEGNVLLPKAWHLVGAAVLIGNCPLIGAGSFDYKRGGFRIDGVPEGRWRVRVVIRTDEGEERSLEAEAETGGTVTIDAR